MPCQFACRPSQHGSQVAAMSPAESMLSHWVKCSLITLHTSQIIMQIAFHLLTTELPEMCACPHSVWCKLLCHIKIDTGNSVHCEVIGWQFLWSVADECISLHIVNLTQSQGRDCFLVRNESTQIKKLPLGEIFGVGYASISVYLEKVFCC